MSSNNDLASENLDQNRNPLNNKNNNSIVNDNDDFYHIKYENSKMSSAYLPSLSMKNRISFNDSIHQLNLWILQCQTWIYFHGMYRAKMQQQQQQSIQSNHSRRIFQSSGNVYKLPNIRKRILASIIDYFFIHFFYDQFRMLLMEVWEYDIPFTSMDFKELEKFFPDDNDNIEDLLPKIFWMYVKTIQYATLFYLLYLIYETMLLYGWPNTTYPGATIGKRVLGLRVVSCEYLEPLVVSIPDSSFFVRVQPAGNISFVKAFLRTLVKILPISNTMQCINILSSRFNRSFFDCKINCLVVDISVPAMAAAMTAAAAANNANNNQPQHLIINDNDNNNNNNNNGFNFQMR